MRSLVMKQMVLCFALAVLVSCGGGGGGAGEAGGDNSPVVSADTMTVTVVSQSTGTTTTTYVGNDADTITRGDVFSSSAPGQTMIIMNSPTAQVSVNANGVTPGTYTITDNLMVLSVRYVIYSSPTVTETEIYGTDGSGTITLTSIGERGQQITGSFNAVVYKGAPVSDPTSTLGVSGTFSVKRWQ